MSGGAGREATALHLEADDVGGYGVRDEWDEPVASREPRVGMAAGCNVLGIGADRLRGHEEGCCRPSLARFPQLGKLHRDADWDHDPRRDGSSERFAIGEADPQHFSSNGDQHVTTGEAGLPNCNRMPPQ